jgi:hypothetical protein
VGDPTNQVHDFEPGIAPSGLFWTTPVSPSAVDASPGSGRARYHLERLAVPDFHDFFNAVSPSPTTVPGEVAFDVRWSGGGDRSHLRDATFGFVGDYVQGNATISFTAHDVGSGVVYRSVPDGQKTVSAGVGHERNGVFFS